MFSKYLKGQNIFLKNGLNILDDAFFTSFEFCVINNDLLVKKIKIKIVKIISYSVFSVPCEKETFKIYLKNVLKYQLNVMFSDTSC